MQHLSSERIHLFPLSFGPSLRLDAALLDDPPPLLLLAFQVSGRLLRRARDYREPPLLVELHLERGLTVIASTPKRSEEHTSELQSQSNLVCRLLLEKKKKIHTLNLISSYWVSTKMSRSK